MTSHWAPYAPDADAPWNWRRVVHLHRRAGFAGTFKEIQRDLSDGPNAAIDRFLAGEAYESGVPTDFAELSKRIGDDAVSADNPDRLRAWWMYRMIFSPDPLTERLTLLWHNHFATSNRKVDNVEFMRQQNEIFRDRSRAPFGELLTGVVKHPALLIFLDADANRKEHPNENLGRELMELFSLGVGAYTEADVKDAARALTGWTERKGRFHVNRQMHDDGEKTILGATGRFDGDDLLRLVLEHPATSRRLAWRITREFMGDEFANDASIAELAAGLRERNLDIGWAVEAVLRSRTFFSDATIGARVLGPCEYIVGAVRALQAFDPPPSTLLLAEWPSRLGQNLFHPPTVFGWQGGRSWLTTRSLVGRAGFAADLVRGALHRSGRPIDAAGLCERCGHAANAQAMTDLAVKLLVTTGADSLRRGIEVTLEKGRDEPTTRARRALELALAAPQAQLG